MRIEGIQLWIEKLKEQQQKKVAEYKNRYFRQATSTKPADRPRAEAAALRMAEIAGVKINKMYWVNAPTDAASLVNSLSSSLSSSLVDSLADSFADSLWDSLWASLADSLRASLADSLRASLADSFWVSLADSLADSFWASLVDSFWVSLADSLRDLLRASLADSLRASLADSLRASLAASLADSFADSLWDSLWDVGWLAYYTYTLDLLGANASDVTREKLALHNEISESCFAIWIVPGAAVLCERPQSVEIVDGKLIGVKWR